jgi:hypothetical protein
MGFDMIVAMLCPCHLSCQVSQSRAAPPTKSFRVSCCAHARRQIWRQHDSLLAKRQEQLPLVYLMCALVRRKTPPNHHPLPGPGGPLVCKERRRISVHLRYPAAALCMRLSLSALHPAPGPSCLITCLSSHLADALSARTTPIARLALPCPAL